MQEMISASINIHLFLIIITIISAFYGIYTIKKTKDSEKAINKIKYLQTQYLLIISSLIFTGITVMAINHFRLKPNLIIMIASVSYILYSSIKLHMIRKSTNTNNIDHMKFLKEYVSKKYLTDILVIIFTTIVSFILR